MTWRRTIPWLEARAEEGLDHAGTPQSWFGHGGWEHFDGAREQYEAEAEVQIGIREAGGKQGDGVIMASHGGLERRHGALDPER